MYPAVILALAAALAFVVFRAVRQYYALSDFHGPALAGWTRLWLLRANGSGRMNAIFEEVNTKYGDTARVAPHLLLTRDPDLIRRMNAVRSTFTRAEWYTALRLHPTRDNITSVTDEKVHADIRNRMAPGYAGKENQCMEDDVDDCLRNLFDLISSKYLSHDDQLRPCDLSEKATYFTLDVISRVAFGEAFGFLDADADSYGYIANLKEFLPAIVVFGAYPELQKILRLPIFKAILPKSTDKRGLGKIMGLAEDLVAQRFGSKPVVRKDMLGSFIKRGLTQAELESETLTQITAGSDSTATALRMALYYITSAPCIYTRLMAEAEEAITSGHMARPIVKDSEAKAMPYLQACIKEALRIHPPVTGLLVKENCEDEVIDGKHAPKGTWIAWNSHGVQKSQDVYGSDVDVYRPERWLSKNNSETERARLDRMNSTVDLVFGYGRFGCLGRNVAMMELNKAVIETLLRFDLQCMNPTKPFVERVIGFTLHTDMYYRFSRRESLTSHANGSISAPPERTAVAGAQEQ